MTLHYRETTHDPARTTPIVALGRRTSARRSMYLVVGKRVLDLALIVLSAPIALPLIAFLACLIALRDGTKPFYSQPRVGRDGRIFTIWKLRTMVCDADSRLQSYLDGNPAARQEWETDQKLKCDPRITPLGSFLRRSSMDELPQLWNVLRGDMSLVGPRPMLPEQRNLYLGNDYYALSPGITGSWQISDRNQTSFAARASFDSAYRRNLSFREDLRILFTTVRVVVQATGY